MDFRLPVDNKNGFVLMAMMLFLMLLSLLAFSVLDIDLLESKMNVFYWNKIKSFYLAEGLLLAAEQKLLSGLEARTTDVTVDNINHKVCGTIFYRVVATGNSHGIKTVLQSTVAVPQDITKCRSKPNIIFGRQSFLVR